MNLSPEIGTIAAALLVLAGTVYASNRRDRNSPARDLAEATQMTTEAFTHLMGPYRAEVESLRRRVEYLEHSLDRLRERFDRLVDYARRLRNQISDLGVEPHPWPPEVGSRHDD